MKKHMLFVIASVFLVAGSLHAQSIALVADIPFDFVVGNKTLHAGQYTFQSMSTNDSIVLLRSSDLTDGVLIAPCTCASETTLQQESKLIFKVAGGQHFLWQIWTEGDYVGRQLAVKARETEEANLAQPRLVAILAKPGRL